MDPFRSRILPIRSTSVPTDAGSSPAGTEQQRSGMQSVESPATPPLEHSDVVGHGALLSDSRLVITGSGDKTAVIWDVGSGKAVSRFQEHGNSSEDNIVSVAFAPDSRRAISAGGLTARIWDVRTGQQIVPPMQVERFVQAVAFSPTGERVITIGEDYTGAISGRSNRQPRVAAASARKPDYRGIILIR